MPRSSESGLARGLRGSRSAGLLPLVAGIASAVALTGAAFYTVEQATCGDPGEYIRHDDHVELIGGCVKGAELPPAPKPGGPIGAVEHNNYQP
ncbi:hypothetical protein [Amycolatopsis nigrescens]|uniref:hypothetical protein n=1 Tax=Amycolatopsis nigrescens TaxID=381445 RepID=UPI000478252E|nr:hypothetical protein [Amycolatopsis nigrescens]